jgi:Transposase and inactivated derivatives
MGNIFFGIGERVTIWLPIFFYHNSAQFSPRLGLGRVITPQIDLWKGYRNVVRDWMPNAQVVADRFHVMAQINKELDSQRKREKRQVEDLIKKAESLEKKAD